MSPAPRRDKVTAEAIELAKESCDEVAGDLGVGDHIGIVVEASRVVTHKFACTHPGYRDWYWAVTLVRAARAKQPTVCEVVLLPGEDALVAPEWIPWSNRIQSGDITPGTILATPDNDPRLEPGYTATDINDETDPAEWAQERAIVSELGLGRERVLSSRGRDDAAQRWFVGESGPDNPMTQQAPGECQMCGYFVPLRGHLGVMFGACTNEYSPSDARVVSIDHGCGGHSDSVEEKRGQELKAPAYDTFMMDEGLFH